MSIVASGYAPPTGAPRVSPAAGLLRASAVLSNPIPVALSAPRRIFDQLELPCCVSCALAYALEVKSPTSPALSPIFHYHITRFERASADSGGALRLLDAIVALSVAGMCTYGLHTVPATDAGARISPTPAARKDGKARRINHTPYVSDIRAVTPHSGSLSIGAMRALSDGHPVILGLSMPSGYPDSFLDAQNVWRVSDDMGIGVAHCVMACGFRNDLGAFTIIDSRGEHRFDQGRWWLSYSIVDSKRCTEAYMLV